MSGLKTIALVDYQMDGHHGGWLLQFAETLLRQGNRVVCLSPEPEWMLREVQARAPDFAGAFSGIELHNAVFPRIPTVRLREFFETVARWRKLAALIDKHMSRPPDVVCFGMLDGLLTIGLTPRLLTALFPHRWTGIYFHPRAERLHASRRPRPAFLRSDYALQAANCSAVGILDEGIVESVARFVKPKPVLVFPDFSIPAPQSRQVPAWISGIRARAGTRTIVGCIGALSQRKGIFTLLRLVGRKEMADFFFVFAGRFIDSKITAEQRQQWKSLVTNPPDNCLIRPESIPSDTAFDRLIDTCDVLYAAYHRFPHSSNLLVKAAQFRKPIIVSKGYCMEERARKFSLGPTITEDSDQECLAALQSLRDDLSKPDYQPSEGFERYFQEHSTTRLAESLRQLVHIPS